MTNEELKSTLSALQADLQWEEGGEWLNVQASADSWLTLATALKAREDLRFDYLFNLTCVDWKTHLTMVYQLHSTLHRHFVVMKLKLDRADPRIDSVCQIWRTAEFHEREVYELFGVHFNGHPDLRKLILPDDWQGYPLRKDYEDPVNMIKL